VTAGARLRELLAGEELVVAPGAYDALTARLVAQAGFPAPYMTGAGTAAALDYPDYGLLTLSEMGDNVGRLAAAVSIPVIADTRRAAATTRAERRPRRAASPPGPRPRPGRRCPMGTLGRRRGR
jgi:2-methylisocitrate lyase-like PEP mutase family enzyme